MAAGVTIKLKRKAGAFTNGELAAGEVGLDVTNSKLYASNDGATVYDLDTSGIGNVEDDTSPKLGGNLDAASFRVTNLGSPSGGSDATTKNYVDALIKGFSNWEEPVLNIQHDATLNPGATPATGDRYIVTDTSSLHANFGTITGVGNNDIVEYNGSAFVVECDVSAKGEGVFTYDKTSDAQYVYNGTSWVVSGGTTDHGTLAGLGDDDHTQYSLLSSGSGAPSSTPDRRGCIYVATAQGLIYISTGSSSSADWKLLVQPDSTLNNSAMVIDGGTI